MPYLIPTIHPAAVLRSARPLTDVIAADLAKAKRISENGVSFDENIIHVIPGNPAGVEHACWAACTWMDYWLEKGSRVGIDVETSGLDFISCKLYSCSISAAADNVGVAFTLMDFHTLPPEYEQALTQRLRALLCSPICTKVFHNLPFDTAVLRRRGFEINGQLLDTMGLHHLVQPDIPHDLGWVAQTYLECPPWKLDHGSNKMANTKNPVELLIYNARDSLNTDKCVEPLLQDISNRGMTSTLVYWEMEFAKLATDLELAGIPIDHAIRAKRGAEMRDSMASQIHWMREFLSWPDFNPMSPAHKAEVLFGNKYNAAPYNLGIKATKLTEKTSQPSTSYKAIIDHLEHPFVRKLVDYIETRHTYAVQYSDGTHAKGDDEELLEKPGAFQRVIYGDRLYAKWNYCATKGSRYGSSPNCQNIRAEDRVYIRAPEGRILVSADKDQLELRIVCALAGVREMLEEMAKPNGDPHCLAASYVYGEEFARADAKLQKLLRDLTKNVVYACIYLAGIETTWRTIRERKLLKPEIRAAATIGQVSKVIKGFFGRYVEIPLYHEGKMRLVAKQGYIETPLPFCRRRYFPVQPPPMNEVANWDIQTCGSEIVTKEMCEIQYELKRLYHGSAFIILHVHDQVVVECNEHDAEDVAKLIDSIFGATPLDGPAGRVMLTAKAKIGKSLKDVK